MLPVEIWGKTESSAMSAPACLMCYSIRGEEIAETKGETFFCACRFEKCFLRCFAVVEQKELPMVVVSTYTDGTSVFRY